MASAAQAILGSCCARNQGAGGLSDDDAGERGLFRVSEGFSEDASSGGVSSGRLYSHKDEEGSSRLLGPVTTRPHIHDGYHFMSSLATLSIALMLFFYEAATYNVIFLGRVLPARGKSWCILPFLVLFNGCWAMALWCYLQAHWADPGTVPQQWKNFVQKAGGNLEVAPARLEWQPGLATWCKRCGIMRPERAHHCQTCGICVLRMDHHCPYIFNCVGFNNHKYFLLLLAYSCLTCFVALSTAMPELVEFTVALVLSEPGRLRAAELAAFLLFGGMAFLVILFLAPMVPAHAALAARNETSIEGNYANMPNPFNQGDPAANLAQIFGTFGADWFFPVRPRHPLSDGVSFPRSDESRLLNAEPELPASVAARETPEERNERLWRRRYRVPLPGSAASVAAARTSAALTRGSVAPVELLGPFDLASRVWVRVVKFLGCAEK